MMNRHFLLLVNPRARNGARYVERVEARLAQAGIDVTTVSLKPDIDASAVLDSQAQGKHAVLVIGGDGTLDRAVRGVLAHNLPLGILPAGENNSLARSLHIPDDVDAAMTVILQGDSRRIDVAEVNGNPFLGVAIVGNSLETAINHSMALRRAYGVTRQIASVVRFLVQTRLFYATLGFGDRRGRREKLHLLLQLVVANNHPFKDTSGMDVYALRVKRWRDLALLFPLLLRGIRALWPAVEHTHTQELEVYTRVSQPVYADDRVLTQTPAVFKVREKAIRVFVPEA